MFDQTWSVWCENKWRKAWYLFQTDYARCPVFFANFRLRQRSPAIVTRRWQHNFAKSWRTQCVFSPTDGRVIFAWYRDSRLVKILTSKWNSFSLLQRSASILNRDKIHLPIDLLIFTFSNFITLSYSLLSSSSYKYPTQHVENKNRYTCI